VYGYPDKGDNDAIIIIIIIIIIIMAQQPPVDEGILTVEASRSHSHTIVGRTPLDG